jgi:SAM-dependent methyltransferase
MLGVFYQAMHLAYQGVFGEQHMLHYPLYQERGQSLMEGQRHFTDYCLSFLPELRGKRVLEIGCGNGVQALYLYRAYEPGYVYAIDINRMHVEIATREKQKRGLTAVDFAVDDAQTLQTVPDGAFDAVLCTESAHHYPDKDAFLAQVKRVLRPGGQFVIADLLRRDSKPPNAMERRLSLYHWPKERYEQAFARLELELVAGNDFTDQVLRAFETTDGWFVRPPGRSLAGHSLGSVFGRGLIKLYTYQLTHALYYYLMSGRKAEE